MLPSLKPRQHVLSIATKKIKKDDLVVVKDSSNYKLIKRVAWIDDDKINTATLKPWNDSFWAHVCSLNWRNKSSKKTRGAPAWTA